MRWCLAGGFLLTLLLSSPAWAQPEPLGLEFQVNEHTTFSQRNPQISGDGAGRFVVVWYSIGQDPGTHDYGVFGRLFDSTGSPVGGDIQLHEYVTGRQADPSVAMHSDGSFVAVWSSANQDGSGYGVFGRFFDSTGGALGGEFQVNTWTAGDQMMPSVAMDGQGDFVVVWSGASQVDGAGIVGQRFDSTGAFVGGDFQVNVNVSAMQRMPDIASNDVGDFAVAWASWYQDGHRYGTFMRWFDTAGTAPVGGFQVNEQTRNGQVYPSVAIDEDGAFLVVWMDEGWSTSEPTGIFGQRYDSDGSPDGGNFMIQKASSGAGQTGLGMNGNGDFAVAWSQWTDGDNHGIFGKFFDRTGSALGPAFQVNTYTTYLQREPRVSMDESGDFVVVWTSRDQYQSGYSTYGQRFAAPSFEILDPLDDDTLDCIDPRNTRPTITWDPSRHDRFKVFLAGDDTFSKGVRVSSGDRWLRGTSWTPGRKKWRRACRKAVAADPNQPEMYIRVMGKDRDLPKKDPGRKAYTPVVEVNLQVPAQP